MNTTVCLLLLKLPQSNIFVGNFLEKAKSRYLESKRCWIFLSHNIKKKRIIFLVQYPCICWNGQWVIPSSFQRIQNPFPVLWKHMVLPVSPSPTIHVDVPRAQAMKDLTVLPEKFSGAECGPSHLPARGKKGRSEIFRDYSLFWFFSGGHWFQFWFFFF